VAPVAGLLSKTWMKPGDPGTVGLNVTEPLNEPGCPRAPVTDAVPLPMTTFEASRTSIDSWLCCVALPQPETVTGLDTTDPAPGDEIVIRSGVHPRNRQMRDRNSAQPANTAPTVAAKPSSFFFKTSPAPPCVSIARRLQHRHALLVEHQAHPRKIDLLVGEAGDLGDRPLAGLVLLNLNEQHLVVG